MDVEDSESSAIIWFLERLYTGQYDRCVHNESMCVLSETCVKSAKCRSKIITDLGIGFFSLVNGERLFLWSNKCTTRTIDFAIPVLYRVLYSMAFWDFLVAVFLSHNHMWIVDHYFLNYWNIYTLICSDSFRCFTYLNNAKKRNRNPIKNDWTTIHIDNTIITVPLFYRAVFPDALCGQFHQSWPTDLHL